MGWYYRTKTTIIRTMVEIINRAIYVAGPLLNGHTASLAVGEENMKKAMDIALGLMQKNWAPYVPHFSLVMYEYVKKKYSLDIPWKTWMTLDYTFINKCGALFYIGSSKGADAELAYAKKKGIKIYYHLDEVPTLEPEDVSELC